MYGLTVRGNTLSILLDINEVYLIIKVLCWHCNKIHREQGLRAHAILLKPLSQLNQASY